jgi:5-methylcytosine-specific restriction endonuclease McrA
MKKRATARQREYSKLLQDPRWQQKRLLILQRDNWRCTACHDSRSNLQIHHGYYGRNMEPWSYPDESLFVLCDNCHEKAEEAKQAAYEALGHIHPADLWDTVDVLKKVRGMFEGKTAQVLLKRTG